jgi:hypothetical protein
VVMGSTAQRAWRPLEPDLRGAGWRGETKFAPHPSNHRGYWTHVTSCLWDP